MVKMLDISYSFKILIVDPNVNSRNELKISLQHLGIKEITFAASGVEACVLLQEADNQKYDLIISEFHMEPMNGLELLQYLRQDPKYIELPFMMATNENKKDNILDSINSGVDEYVIKPIKVQDIRTRIGKIMGKRLSVFITQLRAFATTAEASNDLVNRKDLQRDKKILNVFKEKFSLIREGAKQFKLPHIDYIASLSQEVAANGYSSKSKNNRRIINCLWDSISTIKVLFETTNSQTMEENSIIVNRLEKTLKKLKVNRVSLSDSEVEALTFENMVKHLLDESDNFKAS